MNVSTDRRHPFYTSNDYNRFRQFGFTQQNIVVNIDDEESDTEVFTGKGSLRHWRLGYNLCFTFISIFLWQGNSLILQRKQAYLFLSYFSSPAFTKTNSSLGWGVVQKYVHMNKNHETTLPSAAIIAWFFFIECRGWLTTNLSSHSVQSASSFRRHLHCIGVRQWIFPI